MKLTLSTAGLLVAGLTLASAPAARAEVRVGVGVRIGGGYDDYRGHYQARGAWRFGYERGIEEGHREGERDARRYERFAFYDESRYRDSDRGYRRWMGPRFEYERAYRRGFGEGYARAYRRYARYDRDERHRYDHRGRW
jgi:hypothetical protein